MAEEKIEEILSKGKQPIIVGGTGLYVDTLVKGIEFFDIENDFEYRNKLEEETKLKGIDWLHDELKKVDPVAAENIEKNNVRRVIRALEIYKVTGKTKTELDKESVKGSKYDYYVFGLLWDREELYKRINLRVDIMLEMGLIEEVKSLIQNEGFSKTSLQGLGYKEVIEYIEGIISYEEMIEKIKMETRRYAKRQMTWFKKNKNIVWLDAKNKDEIFESVIKVIK